jgi:hypothetical protein
MKETLSLGPVPWDEECVQVGAADYRTQARKETRAYINQLERRFPERPEGVEFAATHSRHDFGTYVEVSVVYDGDNIEHTTFAYDVERDSPATWDEEAKKELGL